MASMFKEYRRATGRKVKEAADERCGTGTCMWRGSSGEVRGLNAPASPACFEGLLDLA
jgi:hypothetical protein